MARGSGTVKFQEIPMNKIKISRNSRMDVGAGELYGLMQSIKEVGLLQPIGVSKSGNGYEICYGNRRFLACSKLGMRKIPVIIQEQKHAHEIDVKNLSENVQRRNISLAEVGRYLEILAKEGLTAREVAVRLGVSVTYVKSCQKAWSEVPTKFRDSLEVRQPGDTTPAQSKGKISISTVNAIASARRTYDLSSEKVEDLYKAAKSDERFRVENVNSYAAAIAAGKKDFINAAPEVEHVSVSFVMPAKAKAKLIREYVDEGPFKGLGGLVIAVLRGEKNVKFDILK